MTFIVCQLSNKQDQEALQESFRQLDKNSDGKLSKQEMIEGYAKIYPEMTKEQI